MVSHSTSDDPQLVNIDCTGLGGHGLGGFKDYDICIRTDKHGQSIYGLSVTPLESPGRDSEHHVSLVALHGSKAMHEFLVLHYMATDSAEEWDTFLDLCLPHCTWIRAGSRRALALHMFDKCHVAPSHRRLAHPSWIASMKLMLDLLLGARQRRYLRSRPFDNLCENPTTRQLPVLTQSTVSGIGVSRKHTKPKHKETSTNVEATLFTTNKEGTNVVVAYCYVGSSAHLLVFLRNNMHSFMHEFNQVSSKSNHLENFQWKSNFKNMIRSSSKLFNSSSHAKFHRNPSKSFKFNEIAETSKQCQKYVIRASQ